MDNKFGVVLILFAILIGFISWSSGGSSVTETVVVVALVVLGVSVGLSFTHSYERPTQKCHKCGAYIEGYRGGYSCSCGNKWGRR